MNKREYYDVKILCSNCGIIAVFRMPKGIPLNQDKEIHQFYWFRSESEEEADERTYLKCKQCSSEKELFKVSSTEE